MKQNIFIASATEDLDIAYTVQQALEDDAHPTVWRQGVFNLSGTSLQGLLKELDKACYGIFIFTPADITKIRNKSFLTARDNVIFELGLFVGRLGIDNCYIFMPRGVKNFHLPSDLAGITVATYEPDRPTDELAATLGPACHQVRLAIKQRSLIGETIKHSNVIGLDSKLIKKIVCYNQGAYAQYSFLASEIHKKLKTELYKSTKDKKQIEIACNELEEHLYLGIRNACKFNFEFISEYFSLKNNRSKTRVCVKANSGEDNVSDIFRNGRNTYGAMVYPIANNTGFKEVSESGLPFICNNIPEYSANKLYYNPRLKQEKVKIYYKKYGPGNNEPDFIDPNWIKCWKPLVPKKGEIVPPRPDECYKSTLIIPMTFLGNQLESGFKKHFNINRDIPGKAIYGYLCFDNKLYDFFNEDIDINFGIIMADILSLYMVINLTYADYSQTYSYAKKNNK